MMADNMELNKRFNDDDEFNWMGWSYEGMMGALTEFKSCI